MRVRPRSDRPRALPRARPRALPRAAAATAMDTSAASLHRLLHCLLLAAVSVLVFAPSDCGALVIRVLRVPAWVPQHQSAHLLCQYEAQGQPLYSVKWYKNKKEFYRYMADEQPHIRTFHMDGIHVDESRSNDTTLHLSDATAATAGEYTCEVSLDAPTFLTAVTSARLNVVSLPTKGPKITGLDDAYVVGQTIDANCSIGPAWPRANLRWFLNGKEIDHRHQLSPSSAAAPPPATAAPSWRALRLPVETVIFDKGRRAELRCAATVGDLDAGSADFSATLGDMRVLGNQRLAQYSAATRASSATPAVLAAALGAAVVLRLGL